MIENAILKAKLKKELNHLKLAPEQEDAMVNELNSLSNLLLDIYIMETQNGRQKTKRSQAA